MIRQNRTQAMRAKVIAKSAELEDKSRWVAIASAAVLALAAVGFVSSAKASGAGGFELESPHIDQGNKKSLQRGAQAFINNCMGCHSAGYQRYSRLAQDLGLSEDDVSANLIFTTDDAGEATKVGALMTNTMSKEYGKQAFGVVPPNLALTARSRGVDWIYTYLKTYYTDTERAGTGVNNLVYPGTAMPNVLWRLQGEQIAHYGDKVHGVQPITSLELKSEGTMSEAEFDGLVADITNFMAYVADPIKQTRHRIGFFVMLFLFVLLIISYALKKEYWKDVIK